MRGKAKQFQQHFLAAGITPAYAGKSGATILQLNGTQDHPRLCGEKFNKCSRLHNMKGSPPPMRGKAILKGRSESITRITPAYAGKS